MSPDEKRTAILNAACKLIVERGFHGTPMPLLAQEAGVAVGSVYRYFPSKEVLLQETYADAKRQMGACIQLDSSPAVPYKEQLMRLWMRIFTFYTTHPDVFLFLEHYASSPMVTQQVRAESAGEYAAAVHFLAEGQRLGVLRPMPIELLATLVHGSVATAARLAIQTQNPTPEWAPLAAKAAWDAVRID